MPNNEILSAICRTFLHSLWQGLVAAIIAGAVLALTRHAPARRRYNMLGAILLLCMTATGITLFLELRSAGAATPVPDAVGVVMATGPAPLVTTGYWDVLIHYLNTHAPFIMLVWGIVFLFKCFRIGFGFFHIYYIRHYKTSEPDNNWSERLRQLAAELGIRRHVRLAESALVQVPLTTGFIRPCIFVPLGLLAQLPADQVEAILLHELAHIRRGDYLVNIVQRFTDSIFFFNPALLWISARLREEREACCDDVALAHTPHKASYLHALVSFAEHSQAGTLEMAISRNRNFLLNRVKRMLTRENQKLSLIERSVLIIGLLVISAFTFIPEPAASKQPERDPAPFIIYLPTAGPMAKAAPACPPPGDTLVPQGYVFSSKSDSSNRFNVNLNFNTDSSFQNFAYNFGANGIQTQYNFEFQPKANFVVNEKLFINLDSTYKTEAFNFTLDSSFKNFNYNYKFEYQTDTFFQYRMDTTIPKKIDMKSNRDRLKTEWKKEGKLEKDSSSLILFKKKGEWEAGKDRWEVKTKEWKDANGKWATKTKEWKDAKGKWEIKTKEWKDEKDKWEIKTKEWKNADAEWKKDSSWKERKENWEPYKSRDAQPKDIKKQEAPAKGIKKTGNEPAPKPAPAKPKDAFQPAPAAAPASAAAALGEAKASPGQLPAARPQPARKAAPATSHDLIQTLPGVLPKVFILPERIDC